MRDTTQALDRAGGLEPGTLNDNLNSPAQPVNRQQRRSIETETVHFGRERSRTGDPSLRDLGSKPNLGGISALSSETFLRSIFGNEWPRAWVTSFPDFPTGPGDWTGGVAWARRDIELDGNANLFFCIALMKPGATQRSVGNVEGHRVIVADDIGTKVPREKWEALLAVGFPAPMWRIETSPGNQTWLWVLDQVVPAGTEGEKDVLKLRALIAAHGLSDRVVTMDPARYTRLPGGWNSKQKYRREDGGWPRVKVVEHLEGKRVTLDQMGVALAGEGWRDADLPEEVQTNVKSLEAAHSGALVRRADMNDPEPIVRLAQEVGLNPVQIRRGVVQATCPNAAQHTDGRGDGFAFLGNGVMQCMHDHCQHLATPDFRRMICVAFDAQVDARKAVGLPVVANSAGEFLAREDFRRHGAFDDEAIAQVEADAEAFAARQATTPLGNGGERQKGEPPHTLALRLLTAAGVEIYRDTKDRAWIKLAGRNHDISSRAGLLAVCGWLSTKGVDLTGTARSNFKDAAEARAMDSPPRDVHFRQADGLDRARPAAFINLMDGSGTGVHVDGSGWRVGLISRFPVEMADRSKAMPLPDPMRANDGVAFLDRWGRHVPLAPIQSATDPRDVGVQHRAIWTCFLLSQFYRPGTVPHLLFAGHQGSGKTTTARRATGLTDPDSADVLASLPADETAIYAIASQQTNLVIDNVSSIRSSHSDVFCALASGTSYQKRQLYTDGERAVFRAKTSVMLTSIRDELIQREDLMDRTLVLSLPRLDRRKRKSEGEMNEAWERDLPFLFADLLDLLAAALVRLPTVQAASSAGLLSHPPRFADAALLAEAACQSLGWKPGLCLDALNATRQSASADQLENNPVAFRVRELVRQMGGAWSGSPAALLDAIRFIGGPEWDRRVPTVSSFTHALSRAEEPMRQAWAVDVRRSRNKSGDRLISLQGPAQNA